MPRIFFLWVTSASLQFEILLISDCGIHRLLLTEEGRPEPRRCRGDMMLTSGQELNATRERIAHFQRWLAPIRQTALPEESGFIASGNRLELERMQSEVLEYLLHPASVGRERQPA